MGITTTTGGAGRYFADRSGHREQGADGEAARPVIRRAGPGSVAGRRSRIGRLGGRVRRRRFPGAAAGRSARSVRRRLRQHCWRQRSRPGTFRTDAGTVGEVDDVGEVGGGRDDDGAARPRGRACLFAGQRHPRRGPTAAGEPPSCGDSLRRTPRRAAGEGRGCRGFHAPSLRCGDGHDGVTGATYRRSGGMRGLDDAGLRCAVERRGSWRPAPFAASSRRWPASARSPISRTTCPKPRCATAWRSS